MSTTLLVDPPPVATAPPANLQEHQSGASSASMSRETGAIGRTP